jgi:virginiamycin A acetyltransferase
MDYTFLKDDKFTKIGCKSYENGAVVSRSGTGEINIGNYCSIAQFVYFIVDGGNHTFSKVTSFPLFDSLFLDNDTIDGKNKIAFRLQFEEKKGITIGNDVWIGSGSYIMPGVKIGNGVTVAANSVVTKDVIDYAIVAGCPARVVKMKHDSATIAKLNKIAWWNWEEKIIKLRINDFYKPSIDTFVKKYYDK